MHNSNGNPKIDKHVSWFTLVLIVNFVAIGLTALLTVQEKSVIGVIVIGVLLLAWIIGFVLRRVTRRGAK